MDSPVIFAIITAYNDKNAEAILADSRNQRWFESSTEPIDGRLVITIPDGGWRAMPNGIRLGRNSGADVIVCSPESRSTSNIHCTIFIHPKSKEIILRDHSRWGTSVGLNNEVIKLGANEEWTLAPSVGERSGSENVVIRLPDVRLRIEFPNHEAAPPRYCEKLESLIALAGRDGGLYLGDLALETRITTQAHSGTHTPRPLLSYVKKEELGQGNFDKIWLAEND